MEGVSRSRTSKQLCNLVFVKTHKTASTTMKDILMRYGYYHDKAVARFAKDGDPGGVIRLPEAAALVLAGEADRSDIIVHHVSPSGDYVNGDFGEMRRYYQQIMREDDELRFVTILREARSHYMSHYSYFIEPYRKVSLEDYLSDEKRPIHENLLCSEFGIHTTEELDYFITEYLPTFALIMDAGAFDEGMVMLARLLKWDLVDVLYASRHLINDGTLTHTDGRPIKKALDFEDLSPAAQARLDAALTLDVRLNEAAGAHYAAIKAAHAGLEEDMIVFAGLQEEYRERNIMWERMKAENVEGAARAP